MLQIFQEPSFLNLQIQSLKEFSLVPGGAPLAPAPAKRLDNFGLFLVPFLGLTKIRYLAKIEPRLNPRGHPKMRKIHKSAFQEGTLYPFNKTSQKLMISGPSQTLKIELPCR